MILKSFAQSALLVGVCSMLGACAWAADPAPGGEASAGEEPTQPMQDAWIDLRLESAYLFNGHLNNFNIQTDVDRGAVLLTGTVQSDIDRDLAEEIARSLTGVKAVNNHLLVKETLVEQESAKDDRSSAERADDADTTARVQTRIDANEHLTDLDIDVETRNAVVRLEGEVSNHAQRQLAGLIARNTPDVRSVANELRVQPVQPVAQSG